MTAMVPAVAMAAGLDPARLRPLFERYGRLHIPRFLRPADARRVGDALAGDVPWIRSILLNGKAYDLGPGALAALTPERARQIEETVAAGARAGFQYQFDSWRLSDVIEAGEPPPPHLGVLAELYRFLNSPGFLNFVHALTGEHRADYCDAQATRYRAGDFLTAHDDDVEGKQRLFAYVLSFTPVWRPDWGGLLLFHDRDGHVAEGYTPSFNALNIFRVPQAHAVSQVASFVAADRLSVTGWIRYR